MVRRCLQEDTTQAPSEQSSSWSSSQGSSRFRLHGRDRRVNRFDSAAVPGTLILPPWQQRSGNRNIVVLVASALVLLYYSTLHECLSVSAFRCQEKNIDILKV